MDDATSQDPEPQDLRDTLPREDPRDPPERPPAGAQAGSPLGSGVAAVLLLLGTPLLLGLAVALVFGGASGAVWVSMASLAMPALSIFALGGLLGFLFGIPRTRDGEAPAPESRPEPDPAEQGDGPDTSEGPRAPLHPAGQLSQQRPNTNLEQISDWLTKLLIGVGLVEMRDLHAYGQRVVSEVAASLPEGRQSEAFVGSLLVLFLILGFMVGYLLTRLHLSFAFARADLRVEAEYRRRLDRLGRLVRVNLSRTETARREVRRAEQDLRETRGYSELVAKMVTGAGRGSGRASDGDGEEGAGNGASSDPGQDASWHLQTLGGRTRTADPGTPSSPPAAFALQEGPVERISPVAPRRLTGSLKALVRGSNAPPYHLHLEVTSTDPKRPLEGPVTFRLLPVSGPALGILGDQGPFLEEPRDGVAVLDRLVTQPRIVVAETDGGAVRLEVQLRLADRASGSRERDQEPPQG